MRALLDLMREKRENETAFQGIMQLELCQNLLLQSSEVLKILDPELGDKELIESVAAEMVKLQGFLPQP